MKLYRSLNKSKLLLVAIMLILSTILSVFCFNLKQTKVYAASNYVSMEEVTNAFSNSNFDSSTSSSYPFQPTGYDASSQPKDEDGDNINGVINLKDNEYKGFPNFFPTEEKQYVLMLKSAVEYKTSTAYSLQADSHYQISVMVYTQDDAVASVVLYDANATNISTLSSIQDISTAGGWKSYNFYVSTNEVSTLSIKLGLSANGRGTALFDNITVRELSEKFLNSTKTETDYYVDKRADTGLIVLDDVLSSSKKLFEKTSTYSNVEDSYPLDDSEVTDGKNDSAFVITHEEKTFSNFKTADNYLTFEQNNIYKVSVTAKAVNLDGTATIKLVETGFVDGDKKSQSINLSTSGDKFMNGYSKYNFFVKASSTKNSTFKLEISFGSQDGEEETFASGKIYVSEIKVLKIDYSTFNAGSNKIEFTSTDSNGMIANGEFNSLQINDVNKPFPATPDSWTVGLGSGEQVYGVINTKTDIYNKMIADNEILHLQNFKPDDENNNVLMMYNAGADKLTYTSSTKSITAGNEYHAFFMRLFPIAEPVKVAIVYSVENDYITLCSKTFEPSDNWQDIMLSVTSPYLDLDLAVQITLDSDNWSACFVDDVAFDNPAPSEEIFKSNGGVDLSNLLATDNLNNNDFARSTFFVGSGDLLNDTVGILNLDNANLASIVPMSDLNLEMLRNFEGTDKNILAVNAQTETFYTLTSKIGFSLTADSYYKFSIDVFTLLDNDESGAFISLSSFEDSFKNITTSGWETYTFYIKPDTSASNTTISLGIGGTEQLCKGKVFFGNIQFEKLTDISNDDAFNEIAKPSYKTLVVNKVKTDSSEDDNTDTNLDNSGNSVNLWYLIPSLLFGAAIIICVVGVMVRKVKWKKPGKKVKNAYDRNKTVSVQYYTRKATTEREAKARELQKEMDSLAAERVKYEDEYKRDLTKMRELKIKRAPSSEISALDKDMKKNRKLASAIGLSINKLESELNYVKSDVYLNALIKKLSSEKKPVEQPQDLAEQSNKSSDKTKDANN